MATRAGRRSRRFKGAIITCRSGSIKDRADGSDHIHEIVGPVVDKVAPGQLRRGKAYERREEEDVGEVNKGKREECTVFLQVGLVPGDDPERPQQVETPGHADHEKQDFFLMRDADEKPGQGNEKKDYHGPEGDEVGREGYENIRFVCDDMTSIQTDAESAYPPETEIDEDDMSQFVSQHVEIEKERLEEPGEEPPRIEEETDRKIEKGAAAPELKPEGDAGPGFTGSMEMGIEDGNGGNEAEREQGQARQNAKGAREPSQLCL